MMPEWSTKMCKEFMDKSLAAGAKPKVKGDAAACGAGGGAA